VAPRFKSLDQFGGSVGTTEMSGTIWVAGFVDVARPDDRESVCSKFAELDQNLAGAKGVSLLLFFIRADKNALEDYAQRYQASKRWHLVSIPERDSAALIQAWSSATAECRGELRPGNLFVLIDRQDVIRGVYDATAPEVTQKILVDVGDLLRAEQ
jgi:hypothetical protein